MVYQPPRRTPTSLVVIPPPPGPPPPPPPPPASPPPPTTTPPPAPVLPPRALSILATQEDDGTSLRVSEWCAKAASVKSARVPLTQQQSVQIHVFGADALRVRAYQRSKRFRGT